MVELVVEDAGVGAVGEAVHCKDAGVMVLLVLLLLLLLPATTNDESLSFLYKQYRQERASNMMNDLRGDKGSTVYA